MASTDDLLTTKIELTDQTIELDEKTNHTLNENILALKLHNVTFALKDFVLSESRWFSDASNIVSAYFSRFPNLAELILHGIRVVALRPGKEEFPLARVELILPEATALSLRRLVLINPPENDILIGVGFQRLLNLECLYLEGSSAPAVGSQFELPQLRELCLVHAENVHSFVAALARGNFAKLEALIYASPSKLDLPRAFQLTSDKLALRVLLVAGRDVYGSMPDVATLPSRDLPDDAVRSGQTPLSSLQIFVGGDFTKHVRFTQPPPNVAKLWRIDRPMPEFLAKPEVAEIFEGICTARVIRDGPENGLLPWGHPNGIESFYSTSPLTFLLIAHEAKEAGRSLENVF